MVRPLKFLSDIGRETLFIYVAHVAILSLFARRFLILLFNQNVLLPNCPIIRYYVVSTICAISLATVLYYTALLVKKYLPDRCKLLIGS